MALNNFLQEICIPYLVFLIHRSVQILFKTQAWIFSISRFLVKSLVNKNYCNSRTKDDINMELGPVTKRDKRNMTKSKHFDYDLCRQIMTSLPFFQFIYFFIIMIYISQTNIYINTLKKEKEKKIIHL